MMTPTSQFPDAFCGYRFPGAVIAHADCALHRPAPRVRTTAPGSYSFDNLAGASATKEKRSTTTTLIGATALCRHLPPVAVIDRL